MATPGGYWRPRDPNKPVAPATTAVPAGTLTPDRPVAAAPPPAALGIPPVTETPEQRAARTGVNVGGTGAVSGQVAPPAGSGVGTSALAALGGGATQTGPSYHDTVTNAGAAPPAGAPAGPSSFGWRAAAAQQAPAPGGAFGIGPGVGDGTATVQSGLTTGGGTATRTGAITSSGGGANTGTTAGYNPLGPTVGGAVGSIPVVGGLVNNLVTSSAADLSPALNAQKAAFGITDDLDRERYDYRPGDAPSMNLDSDVRQRQLTSLDALTGAANGTVASAAELQARREAGRAVAATLGQARALGGRSAGGAARAGTMAAADILSRTAAEGAERRAAEQDLGRARLSAALGATRGQDTDISKANLDAQLTTEQLAEKHRLSLLDARLKSLGIGADAGVGAVAGSVKNAEAENKYKGGILGGIASKFGL